jgi:uncharacterized RmlC-like cupin family protein
MRLWELSPTIDPKSFNDGRGAILTYLLPASAVEANIVRIKAGHKRGYHYHTEFTEMFLVVSGFGVYSYQNPNEPKVTFKPVHGGEFFVIPPGVPHVLHAIDDMICVALLSKAWDDCDEPITKAEVEVCSGI